MSCFPITLASARVNGSPLLVFKAKNGSKVMSSPVVSASSVSVPNLSSSVKERVDEMVAKHAAIFIERSGGHNHTTNMKPKTQSPVMIGEYRMDKAYALCGDQICEQHGKSAYLATFLWTPQQRRASWAVFSWVRRTDQLVDGPQASTTTLDTLDQWEKRLNDIFQNHPHDIYDAALCDTISKFLIDIQPFKELIEGMRMDLKKSRCQDFDELYLYSYYVAGSLPPMLIPVIDLPSQSESSIKRLFQATSLLLIAANLIDLFADVKEDIGIGRIYIPQDELDDAGLTDNDIVMGVVNNKWRKFMKRQIIRIKMLIAEAEKILNSIDLVNRWPMLEFSLLFRQMLGAFEANGYDNLTKQVKLTNKMVLMILMGASAKRIHGAISKFMSPLLPNLKF